MKKTSRISTTLTMVLLSMVIVMSCSHDTVSFDPYANVHQYVNSWKDSIGENIDPNHTWNTTREAELTVTANKSGTLRILTRSAFNGDEGRAMLYKNSINDGETLTFTIAVPQDLDTLYSALYDSNGYIDEKTFLIDNGKATINYEATNSSRAKSYARASVRSWNSDEWIFTSKVNDNNYATSVPAGAVKANQGTKGTYYVEPGYTQLNYWESGTTVYFTAGEYNLSYCYLTNGTMYLLPGAKLKTTDARFIEQANNKIYIAKGATLDYSSVENTPTIQAKIYCHGTLTTYNNGASKNIQLGSQSLLYIEADATLKADNISLMSGDGSGNESELINDGTINLIGDLTICSTGHVQNNGTMTVGDETSASTGTCSWVNNGKYTTKNMTLTCGGKDIRNNCWLEVTNTFEINIGDNGEYKGFINQAGAYTYAKDLEFGIGAIHLGANSWFATKNLNINNAGHNEYGFYGPTSGGYGLITAKNKIALKGSRSQKYGACYHNNLIVASKNNIKEVPTSDGNYPIVYKVGDILMINDASKADIYIPKSECSPGYGTVTPPTPVPEDPAMWYYYAFEDLGSIGDFDFNDVVLRVSAPSIEGTGEIQLCAAGGTLETTIYLGNEPLGKDGKYEVHELFGVSTATMVNTYNRTAKPYVTIGTYTGGNPAALNIYIRVVDKGESRTISASNYYTSECPLSLTINGSPIDGTWLWPEETKRIDKVYKDFSKWVENHDYNMNWWLK